MGDKTREVFFDDNGTWKIPMIPWLCSAGRGRSVLKGKGVARMV